jgi:F-type H+-transporting ATPase subunit gamma
VTRLADIQRHMASMQELSDIVGAMHSLAGMRLQETQQALPGIRRYGESLAQAVGAALLLMPAAEAASQTDRGCRAIILCAAEHGFVGEFNERVLESALAVLAGNDQFFVLGSRGAGLAFERGQRVSWSRAMPTRVAGVPDSINALTRELYRRIARGEVSRVEVLFGRYHQGSGSSTERRLLLPLDTKALVSLQPRQPGLHNLRPDLLLEELIEEYVFALLTEAAVESIASENAARFATMEAAHDNVSSRLSALSQEARVARQSEITSELLDLIVGAEALGSASDSSFVGSPASRTELTA